MLCSQAAAEPGQPAPAEPSPVTSPRKLRAASEAMLWQSMHAGRSGGAHASAQHEGVHWSVDIVMGSARTRSTKLGAPAVKDGLCVQLWDTCYLEADNTAREEGTGSGCSGAERQGPETFAACLAVEVLNAQLHGGGRRHLHVALQLEGALCNTCKVVHVCCTNSTGVMHLSGYSMPGTARTDLLLTGLILFVGAQVCEALSEALSTAEGGAAAIARSAAIPAHFRMAPAGPGPAATAPLDPASSPAVFTTAPTPATLPSDVQCTLWPVMVPIDATCATTAVGLALSPATSLTLTLPPYMAVASTRLLAHTLQLLQRLKAAAAAATEAAHACAFTGGDSAAATAGGSPMSSSLMVGLSSYRAPAEVTAEVSVRCFAAFLLLCNLAEKKLHPLCSDTTFTRAQRTGRRCYGSD
jgi:hypothetical protein